MGIDVEEKNLGANGPDWPGGPGLLDWPGLTVSVLNNGRKGFLVLKILTAACFDHVHMRALVVWNPY